MRKTKKMTEEDQIQIMANNEHQTSNWEQFNNGLKTIMNYRSEKPEKEESEYKTTPTYSFKESVYHNNIGCKIRSQIYAEDLQVGTGKRPLCDQCEKLNEN